MELGELWDHFDAIRCINLVSRDDRYEVANTMFQSIDVDVDFFRTERHPNGGLQGCFESHVAIIKEAYDAGYDNVLIFEDDVAITKHFNAKLLKAAINFMESNDDWDMFYLGALPEIKKHKIVKMTDKRIYKVNSLCTHAYVVSRRMMEKFHDAQYYGIPLDYVFVENDNSYAVYPSIFNQRESESDISASTSPLDKIKTKTMRAIEMYGYHINVPLTRLILILLIVWYITILLYPKNRVVHTVMFATIIILTFFVIT